MFTGLDYTSLKTSKLLPPWSVSEHRCEKWVIFLFLKYIMRFYSLVHFCIPAQISVYTLELHFSTFRRKRQCNAQKNNLSPSRSSFSKCVFRMERVPPLSTTASSSFLCKTEKRTGKLLLIWNYWQDCTTLWNKDAFNIYLFTLPTQEQKSF